MLTQKSKLISQNESSNALKLKTLINGRQLQSLKQKLADQSQKISNFKYALASRNNPSKQEIIKKKNKSNDIMKRDHIFEDCLSENGTSKPSDAQIIAQQYFNNKHKTLIKNKSEIFINYPHQTHQEKEGKAIQKFDRSLGEGKTQTTKNEAQRQQNYENLKTTTSTTASSSSLIKVIQKIKTMNLSDQRLMKSSRLLSKKKLEKQLKIADFEIIKYLEQGQFGAVHLARHIATNFICAIKKIPKLIFGGDPKFINQLAREIKIQSYLEHPNIVRLYNYFHDQNFIYLMMQYCAGGSLFSNLKKQNRVPEQKVKKYVNQICHAVQFMHDNDIIHRDIKPENILLHHDIVKICDFGWSISSPLLRSTHCGTPLYSSPEIILREHYDSKIDIWNIGVLTYELLYGRVPFQIKCEEELIKIVHEDIFFSKHYPVTPAAKDFILKCLKKNPKQREPINKLLDHQFFQQ